jgi:spore germination protein YaaH
LTGHSRTGPPRRLAPAIGAAAAAAVALALAAAAPARAAAPRLAHGPLVKPVLGYLPYWEAGNDAYVESIHWDLLWGLAWFAVEIEADGDLAASHGWPNDTTDYLAAEAELNGARLILAVTAEDHSDAVINALVTSAANRSAAVEAILGYMAAGRARSVNVNFEHPAASSRAGFLAFVEELAAAVHAEWPDGTVTVAAPKIYSLDAYDLPGLVAAADGVMVMGYGYHSRGSARPGPNAPIDCVGPDGRRAWYFCIDEDTTPRYRALLDGIGLGEIWLGLPNYGWDWPTETGEPCTVAGWPAGCATGDGALFTYEDRAGVAEAAWQWDTLGRDLYRPYRSGGAWRQIWCDDQRTWDEKLGYLVESEYGGLGIWALGYEGVTDDLWVQIADRLSAEEPPDPDPRADAGSTADPAPDAGGSRPDAVSPPNRPPMARVGADQRVVQGTLVTLDGSASDDPDGDPLSYDWAQEEGPAVPLMALRSATPRFLAVAPGTYRFTLTVGDGRLQSEPAETTVEVDPAGGPLPDAGPAADTPTPGPDAPPADGAPRPDRPGDGGGGGGPNVRQAAAGGCAVGAGAAGAGAAAPAPLALVLLLLLAGAARAPRRRA